MNVLGAFGRPEQYLARYAEPELLVARVLSGTYRRALVVPVRREAPSFVDGYLSAARAASGRTLCIVVVNDDSERSENAALLRALEQRLARPRPVSGTPRIVHGSLPELDLLLIDRASKSSLLPGRQGVGLARKIGCDLALALWHERKLATPLLCSTDADVLLADDYFASAEALLVESAAAGVHGFWHRASGDAELDRATALYEISLRYYVLGLRWAGSPYAFHTIGSTIAMDARAYATVRGFPRRRAGEDFYLLGKLAKVGTVVTLPGDGVRILARRSDRVPFGTGPAVGRLLGSEALTLYDPRLFACSKQLIGALDAFAAGGSVGEFMATLKGAPGEAGRLLPELAEAWRLPSVLASARAQCVGPERLARRLHTWFDAFRTLKLIHALRDRGWPSLPWRTALREAVFVPPALAEESDLDVLRRGLLALERSTGGRFGAARSGRL